MRELLLKYLIKFIYKTEKDAVLPSILFPINDEEYINENMKLYIQKVNFGDENPSYDIRGNIVNIIFGLNLPLIYPYLYNMMNFASTLSKEYIYYEKKIREKTTENEEFDFKKMQEQLITSAVK